MAHQCVRCSRILPQANDELIKGCKNCGGKFFFYIKDELLEKAKNVQINIPEEHKKIIEKDIREMAGIADEETPVIMDFESIRVTGEGKFEIDVVNLFNKSKPLIYKLEDGKYIIDLSTTLKRSPSDLKEAENLDDKQE